MVSLRRTKLKPVQSVKSAQLTRRFPNVRRAFKSFSTEQAWTFVVRFKGQRRFCRVDRTQNARYLAERQRDVLDLFHRLYPMNSLVPIGLVKVPAGAVITQYAEEFAVGDFFEGELRNKVQRSIDRKKRGMSRFPLWGVVTEIERRQSPDFKVYQREVRDFSGEESAAGKRHEKFMGGVAYPVANKIFKESGIAVDYPGNISNVRGNPLFFEPKITAPKRLVEFIRKKPRDERVKLMRVVRNLGLV